MLADFVPQLRAGIFPVVVGQTELAFNGAVDPLRVAPSLFYHRLAGFLDLVTGRQLGCFVRRHLCVLVVTPTDRVAAADALANSSGLAAHLDILGAEQFLGANLHERCHFESRGRKSRMQELVGRYNHLNDRQETHLSPKIQIVGRDVVLRELS